MKEQYKGQFESWQPGYPAIFHGVAREIAERSFNGSIMCKSLTMKTHNITINAIKKAGGYE